MRNDSDGNQKKGIGSKKGAWLFAMVASSLVMLTAWSVNPVKLEMDKSSGAVLLGTQSHLLPLLRGINWLVRAPSIQEKLVPLDWKTLQKESIERMQHDNFGDLADWDALQRFVATVSKRSHFVGRFFFKQTIQNVLDTHLYIHKQFQEHPEIASEKLVKPIFLSAYTRTGATFLYQVFADTFDQELRSIKQFEIHGGPLEFRTEPPFQREIAEVSLKMLNAINSPMTLMHEWTTADDAEEDSGWYTHTGLGVVVPFMVPSEWHNMQFSKPSTHRMNQRFMDAVLKIKQYQEGNKGVNNPPKRFILKAPEHLFGLPHLHATYPDATFVTAYRDELPMYKSSIVITHQFQQMFIRDPRISETADFCDALICQERRALEIAHNGTFNVMKVPFEGLFTETFSIVERFAKHADLPWDEDKQAHARKVIESRLSWKKTKSIYKMDEFDLSQEKIMQRLDACDAVLKAADTESTQSPNQNNTTIPPCQKTISSDQCIR